MIGRLRSLLVPAACTLVVAAILVGLGVWQLKRLAWKEALLARIETRTKAPPQPLPARSDWAGLAPDAYEYRHVEATGTFDHAAETLILRASSDGPGYHVITPFQLDGGGTVLVDRGFVPMDLKARRTREAGEPTGEVRLTGLLRAPEPRNMFTPADDVARGEFFTRDPAGIAAYDHLENAAPFSIDADPTMTNPGGWPKPVAAALGIPNNHLSYALTWFGLALGVVGVFLSYGWTRFASNRKIDEAASTRLLVRATHHPSS